MASGLIPSSVLLILSALTLAGCSPLYVMQSAAGHADLLLRRRGIAAAAKDPRTPGPTRSRLELALDVRRYAFETIALDPSRDYSTYVALDRPAVTYLVSGSRKTKLEPYTWSFPFAGRFPYKGHFSRVRALREKAKLERKGYDAVVGGAAAYNTPLPFSDPLPSSALELSTGALASLLIHELAHGTVFLKNHMNFNEAAAEFIGRRGAQEYLAARFGRESAELAEYRDELERDGRVDAVFARLRGRLEALYAGPEPESEKLRGREAEFSRAVEELAALGEPARQLNNAVVLAQALYHDDQKPFEALFDACGGDWRRFLAALKAIDRRRPLEALRLKTACS